MSGVMERSYGDSQWGGRLLTAARVTRTSDGFVYGGPTIWVWESRKGETRMVDTGTKSWAKVDRAMHAAASPDDVFAHFTEAQR